MTRIRGIVERVTYQNEENGYTVARFKPDGKGAGLVTVVGNALSMSAGESLALEGEWTSHAQYGRQFKIDSYENIRPATAEGMKRYLGSGLIKGVGPVTATRIVDHFGTDTLQVIEDEPRRLSEVPGLGAKRVRLIVKAWQEQKEIHNVMLFLQSHQVGTGHAVKIWKRYGQEALQAIEANPYRLATDVWGIGFQTADRIARKMGVEMHSEQRILAGIRYVLETSGEKGGHVYLPREELVRTCVESLEVPGEMIEPSIDGLAAREEAVLEAERVYLPPLFYSEKGTATRIHQLSSIQRIETGDIQQEIVSIEKRDGVRFARLQKVALEKALSNSLLVLTGGPGTGKTTTIKGLLTLLEARGKVVVLAAPTGRAAKRMSEATNREAKTIHRLLKFNPSDMAFEKNFENPLEADAIIVDEVSMVDVVLMNSLLRAIPISSTLVLVGDVDQLPSVGPGNVLKDIITSGAAEVVGLNEIFRQAQTSSIVMNAHTILAGEFPDLRRDRESDFFLLEEEDPSQVCEVIAALCKTRLPRTYGVDPVEDIQVLTPMYRGDTGATNLNGVLQDVLNPSGREFQREGSRFRVGDKVMQVRNNYDKDVFNGDMGRIEAIDDDAHALAVRFPDKLVEYESAELDEIVLSYAITVHKSQGSEYRIVVLPLTTQHFVMLQRNLLYTAITRARDLVVIVGSRKALSIAIRNNQVSERYSSLPERIRMSDYS